MKFSNDKISHAGLGKIGLKGNGAGNIGFVFSTIILILLDSPKFQGGHYTL